MFFFNDTATTEIYTLSLHDALPISLVVLVMGGTSVAGRRAAPPTPPPTEAPPTPDPMAAMMGVAVENASASGQVARDRKSTRLNSSHANISYAVFCLKKKTTNTSMP